MHLTTRQLNDLGSWLGDEATTYLKLRAFVNDLEDNPSPQGQQFLDALTLVHRGFELILRNPE